MAKLLDNVPQSRMFDEMIKLLQTGHALASLEELRKHGLHQGVFPIIDLVLDEAHRHDGREKFVQLAMADTDRRVEEGRSVAPSFLLACMLWHDVLDRWNKLKAGGEAPFPALQQAIDAVFDARIGDISGRGKLAADMREIWMMQPRFERRSGSTPFALVEQPRYRAGFDFLRLRGEAGEIDVELADWWEDFALGTQEEREALIASAKESTARRPGGPAEGEGAPKKRRRRRRKPAGARAGGGAPAEGGEPDSAGGDA
jgi:poly(A) polymerase